MINLILFCILLWKVDPGTIHEDHNSIILKNRDLEIHVSKTDLLVHKISCAGAQILSAPTQISLGCADGGGMITDISWRYNTSDSQGLELSTSLTMKNTIVKYEYRLFGDGFYWGIKYTPANHGPIEDSMIIRLPFRLKDTVLHHGSDLTGRRFVYRHNLSLPWIWLDHPAKDIHTSLIVAPDHPIPGLSFSCPSGVTKITFNKYDPARIGDFDLYFIIGRNDWRAGLKFLADRYPGYFHPKSDKFKTGEGWYYLNFSFDDERAIKSLSERGVTWTEMHAFFPFYGLYAPRRTSWGLIADSDNTSLASWEDDPGGRLNSYSRTNQQIALWRKYSIQTYLYFQPFEAWHQYAEKYFASDIAKDRSGNNLPAWQYCTLMNPDPASPWGRHIIEQANRIIEKYPTTDGIFYDRMDYCYYDYAHDDGITVIDGKPAYMLGFALEKMNDTIFKIFHNQGKAVWGNGPTSLEVCKNLDGIMAEGSLANLYKTQYLGLIRPIVYLPYDKTPDETEEKLKNCLLCGAFPSVTYGDSLCHNLDEKYRPLFDILVGRTWVLSPNPLTVPEKFQANIFRTRDDDYAVVVISPEKSQLHHSYEYNIPVTVDIPDTKKITNAYLMSGDWPGKYELKFRKTNTRIVFTIPHHLSNSLIILTKGERYQITNSVLNSLLALNDISLTPPKDIFIRSREYAIVKIDLTNNTNRKQSLRITAEAIDNSGEIIIPKTLILGKYETKTIEAQIKTNGDRSFRINARNDRQTFSREFSVKTGLTAEPGDLFHDDFSQGMRKWTINRGAWNTNKEIAEGSGPSHFAYILNGQWVNYQYQVTSLIKGSDDPEVDWLKSYIFFHVKDDRNFYRFGIHGDGGIVDLFKCVNGEWFQLSSANFMPKSDTWYTLMVEVTGNRIAGFVNGKKVIETQDAAFSSGGIGIGVLEDAMRTEYRDVIVKKTY